MAEVDDFRDRVVKILKELKYEFCLKPEKMKLLIRNNDSIVAFLRPISESLGDDEEVYMKLLTQWRVKNWQAYPSVFRVTEEGTRKWVKDQLVNREDRILFMVIAPNNQPIGHLGLSNFNFCEKEAEIDNVVRGVATVIPGIMTMALDALSDWSFEKIHLRRLFLRVFFDNQRAIKLYERCGFKGVKRIPLHKFVEGDNIKYEEIPAGSSLSEDREFYLMEKINIKEEKL